MLNSVRLTLLLCAAFACSKAAAETVMYVTNYGPYPTGSVVTVDPTVGTVTPWLPSSVQSPGAIAVDASGNVYCANNASGNVTKITPSGSSSTLFASNFSGPSGLAFDAVGNLFVSNYYSSQIDKVAPDGTRTTFASGT